MYYSEEFKNKILEILTNSEDMKKRLDDGNEIIGRYLDDSCHNISPDEVINAYENNTIQELYQKAKRYVTIRNLYLEWLELYHEQSKQKRK